jgi:hypothetical protein
MVRCPCLECSPIAQASGGLGSWRRKATHRPNVPTTVSAATSTLTGARPDSRGSRTSAVTWRRNDDCRESQYLAMCHASPVHPQVGLRGPPRGPGPNRRARLATPRTHPGRARSKARPAGAHTPPRASDEDGAHVRTPLPINLEALLRQRACWTGTVDKTRVGVRAMVVGLSIHRHLRFLIPCQCEAGQ